MNVDQGGRRCVQRRQVTPAEPCIDRVGPVSSVCEMPNPGRVTAMYCKRICEGYALVWDSLLELMCYEARPEHHVEMHGFGWVPDYTDSRLSKTACANCSETIVSLHHTRNIRPSDYSCGSDEVAGGQEAKRASTPVRLLSSSSFPPPENRWSNICSHASSTE